VFYADAGPRTRVLGGGWIEAVRDRSDAAPAEPKGPASSRVNFGVDAGSGPGSKLEQEERRP
jgi:hypothetical protein